MSRTKILSQYAPRKDNLLMILHALQRSTDTNHLSHADMEAVAKYLNITLSSVYGVATYYSMFSTRPRGGHIIRLCKSPVCFMKDSALVAESLSKLLGIGVGETSSDGNFTLEESECLGRCETAPSMMIDDRYFGGLNEEKISSILSRYRNEE